MHNFKNGKAKFVNAVTGVILGMEVDLGSKAAVVKAAKAVSIIENSRYPNRAVAAVVSRETNAIPATTGTANHVIRVENAVSIGIGKVQRANIARIGATRYDVVVRTLNGTRFVCRGVEIIRKWRRLS